jgi:hypothetical protein
LGNAPDETKQKQRARFAKLVSEGEAGPGAQLRLAERTLIQVDDPALLRLGRFALAVISYVDRRQFLDCLVTAAVGDALMVWSGREELTAWVVRSALDSDLGARFENAIRHLIALNTVVSHRAADALIGVVGTDATLAMRAQLRTDLYESSSIASSGDPCTSWRRWTREDCATCAERTDLPAHYIAKQLEKYCSDPAFMPTPTAVSRVVEFAQELNMQAVSATTGHTIDDHHLGQVEPILCRGDVGAIRQMLHQAIEAGFARAGLSLRQFILFLFRENSLVMTDKHWARAEESWLALGKLPADDVEGTRAEWFLFGLLLPRWSPPTQLARLLGRRAEDHCLMDWRRQFRPLTVWTEVPEMLSSTTELETLQRLIWFIGTHPAEIPSEIVSLLTGFLSHEDSFYEVW